MKKRNLFVGLLLAGAALSLTSCPANDDNTDTAGTSEAESQPVESTPVESESKPAESTPVESESKPAEESSTTEEVKVEYVDVQLTINLPAEIAEGKALEVSYNQDGTKTGVDWTKVTNTTEGVTVNGKTVTLTMKVVKGVTELQIYIGLTPWASSADELFPTATYTITDGAVTVGTPVVDPVKTEYEVTIYDGETVVNTVKVEEGKALEFEAEPKDGYDFDGIYLDAAFTTKYEGAAITANTNVYLKYTAKPVEKTSAMLYMYVDPTSDTPEELEVKFDQEDGGVKYGVPTVADPVDTYRKFAGWYIDKECKQAFDMSFGIDADTTIYAKWVAGDLKKAEFYANVGTDVGAAFNNKEVTLASIYTVASGTEIRSRAKSGTGAKGEAASFTYSIKMNGTSAKLTLNIPASGTVYFGAQNGSSTGASSCTVTKPDGSTDTTSIAFAKGETTLSRLQLEVTEGTYVITAGSGTIDIYDIFFACELENSPIEDLQVIDAGVVDYIEGQTYSYADAKIALGYENKTKDSLKNTDVTFDTSAVDMTKPGTYTVKVTKEVTEMIYGKSKKTVLEATYDVTVYELTGVALGYYATYAGSKSAGGNGTYVNGAVQDTYYAGDTFNSKYLSCTALTKNVKDNSVKTFLLASSQYTVDSSKFAETEGEQVITVSFTTNSKTESETFTIHRVTAAPQITDGVLKTAVNAAYTGVVGAAVEGVNTFKTIQQALEFLGKYYKDAKSSTLTIAEGTYNEKIEIAIPNLTITGAGVGKTIIEWDSLYGETDASGYVQVTDSTQTVAVRDAADNLTIKGVTISNYWNDRSKYIESGIKGAAEGKNGNEHRALALLVQADKFILQDAELLGMQDTVELFKGRQIFKNVKITGTTDYIFGTNNTTLFDSCTIVTKASEDNKTGGYVTAFKGCSAGAADAVDYGAIFYNCKFTAETGVAEKGVALARPWSAYSATAFINCSMDKYIAVGTELINQKNLFDAEGVQTTVASRYYNGLTKAAFDSSTVKVDGVDTKVTTIKAFEHGNTGEGALDDATLAKIVNADGVRIVQTGTDTDAAKYTDYRTIFATTNGKVTYADNWLGFDAKDTTITVKNSDSTDNVVLTNYAYSNTTLTAAELKALTAAMNVAEGYEVTGIYTDADCKTKFDGKLASDTVTLYITTAVKAASTTYTYQYGGTNADSWVEDTANGTIKSSDTTQAVGIKLIPGTYLTLNVSSCKKIALNLEGFTTGSSNASAYISVELYAADGTKVTTLTGTTVTGKLNGAITFAALTDNTYTSTTAITQIKITSNTSGKSVAITKASIVCYA